MESFVIRPIAHKLAFAFASMAFFGLVQNARAKDTGTDYIPRAVGQLDAKLRPLAVPVDYLITPDGFFAPTCVQRVENGEAVLGDGSIQAAGGGIRKPAACTQPHYRFDGARVESSGSSFPAPVHAGPDGITSRWVEAAYVNYSDRASTPLGRLTASWKVPAKPTNQSGQSLFFLTEVEQQGVQVTTLKPVLSYNVFGREDWTISTWAEMNGTSYFSEPISVDEGDLIVGITSCEKANACDIWTVTAIDMSKNDAQISTSQRVAAGGYTSLILGGSLEEAGASRCDQLPASSPFAFGNIFVYSSSFSPVDALLRPVYGATSLPCKFGVSTNSNSPGSVFLSY